MKINLKATDPALVKTPALIVFLGTADPADLAGRPELDGLKDIIGPRIEGGDFTPDHLNTLTLFPGLSDGPERIVLVGLGEDKDLTPGRVRAAAAQAMRVVSDLKRKSAALALFPARGCFTRQADAAEALALGALLGTYNYAELKTKDKDKKIFPDALTLVFPLDKKNQAAVKTALDQARITAKAVFKARDLGNRPANLLHPEALAEEALKIAGEAGLQAKVLDMAAAEQRGLGAFLGVAKGSSRPGRIIILEYRGGAADQKPIALVGKAVTFDSGGLSLKPADHMGAMKTDMAGGAAVLTVLAAAAEMKLKVNLVGVVPAAENMPDGGAYRPGDVLTSMSGQTIEVISTDAEGRLILADALTLVQEDYQPAQIIDLATLTGACVVALGSSCAGLMGNDDDLAGKLEHASRVSDERIWRLPLFEDYFEGFKSESADFKNSGVREGGAINGGLFLKQFIKNTPWAHLDIAGPARAEKGKPGTPAGATGFGINLLLTYLRNL
ncbi:MAG: leucyl aminopeptidase [Pseudomonadota bacterium]